jgi:hypothetical protein
LAKKPHVPNKKSDKSDKSGGMRLTKNKKSGILLRKAINFGGNKN